MASADALRSARAEVDATRVTDEVAAYLVAVVRRTRELPSVVLGASPRAATHLLGAAKAAARLAGRDFVTPDDVSRMASPVLAHRLVLTPEAELDRFRPADAVRTALAEVPVPAVSPSPRLACARGGGRARDAARRAGRRRARHRRAARRRRVRRPRGPAGRRGCAGRLPSVVARGVPAAFTIEADDGARRGSRCRPTSLSMMRLSSRADAAGTCCHR